MAERVLEAIGQSMTDIKDALKIKSIGLYGGYPGTTIPGYQIKIEYLDGTEISIVQQDYKGLGIMALDGKSYPYQGIEIPASELHSNLISDIIRLVVWYKDTLERHKNIAAAPLTAYPDDAGVAGSIKAAGWTLVRPACQDVDDEEE